ncbi:MAG: bile acid:sodium symporter family protein [Erythrobacter sp.]|nr:bile acid:sodium symporter family protein [Erythrobacter sp.]
MSAIARLFDPMVRLLMLALLLAIVFPVPESHEAIGQLVANGAVFFLFLLNGLRLPRDQVLRGVRDWRFHGALALWVFGAMLLGGWGLWQATGLIIPPLLALGFLYLGALPSTVQSATVYTSIANGNVAHAVVAAALLNVLGVFLSAPLFALFAGGESVPFDTSVLVRIAVILLLPFAIGQVLQPRFGELATKNPALTKWTDRIPIALAVYVAMSAAVNEDIWRNINGVEWTLMLAGVLAFLAYANVGSWLAGAALGLDRKDRIAYLFGGSQKSLAMGAPLATILFDPAMAGIILLPLLVYHFLQLVLAAPLASQLAQPGPG